MARAPVIHIGAASVAFSLGPLRYPFAKVAGYIRAGLAIPAGTSD